MFAFLKRRRRKRLLETSPIPESLWAKTAGSLRILRRLGGDDTRRLRELAAIFLAEKEFHLVRGAEASDRIRVLIAAQACLPVLNLGIDWYDDWSTIILTPREYRVERREIDENGVVHEYEDEAAGEVLELGPVVFSVADVLDAGGGYNVIIHEMAHKLDGRGGSMNGMPPLGGRSDPRLWRSDFSAALERLRARSEKGGRGILLGRLDPYAAEDPSEFFAVMCEYFFDLPHRLRGVFPDVYLRLTEFFRQDPAGRREG
jgi:Mlc titration factor MtfA (ptsG expression regulator)